jgi:chemotaxis protein methyltransferase WspC
MNFSAHTQWPLLEALVAERLGLEPRVLGSANLARAVRETMQMLDCGDFDQFLTHLRERSADFDALAERLVVPETWFFRDRTPFRFLHDYVAQQLLPGKEQPRWRALSVPCSTGEEPYSMAMAALAAGWAPGQFEIVACDVSRGALERAARGRYGSQSFRGDEQEFAAWCGRYLRRTAEQIEVGNELRASVRFVQANVTTAGLWPHERGFAAIFCRNLLIYLQPDARRRVLDNLARWLSPGGVLYAGHVEARLILEGPFAPAGLPYPAAFVRRAAASTVEPSAPSPPSRADRRQTARGRSRTATFRDVAPGPRPASLAKRAPTTDEGPRAKTLAPDLAAWLADARQAADAGELDRATRACRAALDADPTSAEAHHLLGLIASARHDAPTAEQGFRRAVFLDPNHVGALTHLMLIAQARGDAATAALYRQRIARAAQPEASP